MRFYISFLILVATTFSACSSSNSGDKKTEENTTHRFRPAPDQIDPAILANRDFKEAPMLAELVAAGELPPVSERLPEHPLVVKPIRYIGRYGGEIRRALKSETTGHTGVSKTLNDNLMGYERPLAKSIQLNLAESYEFQDEGRTAIFKIRKGVKWSDGQPYTVDDILFWYYDMTLNLDATTLPILPGEWFIDGEAIKLEKIDDLTLKASAPKPMGRLLNNVSHDDLAEPKHTLAQYHPRYNPKATYEDFRERTSEVKLAMDPNKPTLSAWAPTEWARGQRIVYTRNPYYWKIDTVGNQLPYADKLSFTIIEDQQVILLKFTNSELDILARYARSTMAPILLSNEKRGAYHVHFTEPTSGPTVYPNWDAQKPALREAFRNKKVRIAMSLAINREEIAAIVYKGLLVPGGFSFSPDSPYYSPEDFQKYSDYNPDKARALLDEAGYRDTDGDGWREFKDGTRFETTVDAVIGEGLEDTCELIVDYWSKIGIRAFLNLAKEEIIFPRRLNGEFEMHLNWVLAASIDPLDAPHQWSITTHAPLFWHSSAATEGPPWLHEASDLVNKALVTIDDAKRNQIMAEVSRLYSDNIPAISVGAVKDVWGSNSRLENVPEQITWANVYRGRSRPIFHEQLFIKE